jgi:hypothetical protein
VPKPIATWNPARSVWETNQPALCGHSVPFSETWPTSGMTRGGVAYALPTSAPRTAGSASSSLLPTPKAYQGSRGGSQHPDKRRAGGAVGDLLPTPRATDGTKGGPNQRGSSGDLMLPSAVQLLPTPAVNDMGAGKTVEQWDEWTVRMKDRHGNGNGHGASLAIEALRLLPTPSAADALGGHLTRSGDRSNELLLPGVAKSIGDRTSPPSVDGSTSPDE